MKQYKAIFNLDATPLRHVAVWWAEIASAVSVFGFSL